MKLMSFGDGAGHLMERLLEHAGISEVDVNTVAIQPESNAAALELLREAGDGRWFAELLNAEGTPGVGEGIEVMLSQVGNGEIRGETLGAGGVQDGGYLRLPLSSVEKVHLY